MARQQLTSIYNLQTRKNGQKNSKTHTKHKIKTKNQELKGQLLPNAITDGAW